MDTVDTFRKPCTGELRSEEPPPPKNHLGATCRWAYKSAPHVRKHSPPEGHHGASSLRFNTLPPLPQQALIERTRARERERERESQRARERERERERESTTETRGGLVHVQGYLTYTRKRTPLGPYRRPMPDGLGGPRRVGIVLWARYPCTASGFCRALSTRACWFKF